MSIPRLGAALFAAILAPVCARAEVLPFEAAATVGTEASGIDAAVSGDFDADGDIDLVYASRGGARVSWSRNERGAHAPRVTLFPRENVQRLVAADFDRDGRVDLVSATSTGTLAWHRGLRPNAAGLAQFETRTALANGLTGVTRLAAGDINQDGRPDLIVGRDESPPLQTFLFTGAAGSGFAAGVSAAVPTGAGRIAGLGVADFDGNGFNDVVATAHTAAGSPTPRSQLFVLPRASASAFGTAVVVDDATSSQFLSFVYGDLAVGDIDGQAGPDVAFVRNSSTDQRVFVRLAQAGGLGTPGAPDSIQAAAVLSPLDALQLADLDRDGDADITFHSGPEEEAGWIENLRGEGFAAHDLGASFSGGDVIAAFAHDDDLDGDPDLLIATGSGALRRLHNRRMHGRPRVFERIEARIANGVALAGPFDVVTRRRGRTSEREVLITEFIGGRVQSFRLPEFFFFGSAAFDAPVVENAGAAREIALFDERFDGDEDFMLATGESASSPAGNQNRLIFSLNGGAGLPGANTVLPCVQGDDIRGVDVAPFAGLGLRAVYAADGNNRVALASCPGETTISTAANGVPNGPGVARLGDLDQDGDPDLLVAARLPDAPPLLGDLVGWYPNTGNGVFGALQRIGVVPGADEATLLDVDRDGRLDVVAVSNGDPALDPQAGRVLLFRSLGDGDFAPPQVAASGLHAPGRVTGADVDHDGDIDLFVPSDSELTRSVPQRQCGIAWLEALDDGAFAPPVCLDAEAARPYTRVAVDDLNRDGMPEVVATSLADNLVLALNLSPPLEFTDLHHHFRADIVLEDGEEACVASYDLESHARSGDNDLALARYRLMSLTPPVPGLVQAVILRRDDGDDVPGPSDTQVARASVFANDQWDLALAAGAGNVAPGTAPARFWACLQAVPRVPESDGEFNVTLPQSTVVDAATGLALPGVFSDPTNSFADRTRVRSARVFGDGLEDG